MVQTLQQFSRRVQVIGRDIERRSGDLLIGATRAALVRAVEETPVDTGLARSSWFVFRGAAGNPRQPTPFVPYPVGSQGLGRQRGETANRNAVIARGQRQLTSVPANRTFIIRNVARHAGELDTGMGSPQARLGMTRPGAMAAVRFVRNFNFAL